MKKTLMRLVLLSVAIFFGTAQPAIAQIPSLNPSPAATTAAQTAGDGPHFLAGENLVITQDYVGDVFATGGQVRVESRIDGDLFVAGGQVVIAGEVTGDVLGAAGTLELRGRVNDDVTVAAGNVTLDRAATVLGNVVVGAGNVDLFGSVGNDVWLAAGSSTLGGQFAQDVKVYGNSAQILPSASISGSLATKLDVTPSVAPTASIAGERTMEVVEKTPAQNTAKGPNWFWIVTSFVTALLLGGLFLLLAPRAAESLTQPILRSPVSALGWGFVYLILLPIVAVVILFTIIGIPIALFLFFVYVVSLLVASWITAFALGKSLLRATGFASTAWTSKLVQFAVGLVVLQLLMALPVVGWLVSIGSLLFGLGSITMVAINKVRGKDMSEPVETAKSYQTAQRTNIEEAIIVEEPVRRKTRTARGSKKTTRRSKK